MQINKQLKSVALVGTLLGSLIIASARADTAVQVNEVGLGNGTSTGGLTLPLGTADFWSGLQVINVTGGSQSGPGEYR